jgi:hypothetical protein
MLIILSLTQRAQPQHYNFWEFPIRNKKQSRIQSRCGGEVCQEKIGQTFESLPACKSMKMRELCR